MGATDKTEGATAMKNTTETKELLLEQLRKTPILETACQKIGISKMTVSRWRKDSKAFNKAVDDALLEGRLKINDIAESQIISLIAQGKFEASKYWLNNNDPRYANKLEIRGTLKHKDDPMSAEQRAFIKRAIKLSPLTPYGKKKK